ELRSLNREQVEFGGGASGRGESAGLASRRHHPMARDDHGNRIAAERLPDGPCSTRIAEARRDLAVCQRRAGRNRSRDVVDPPLVAPLPDGVRTVKAIDGTTDLIHIFATLRRDLERGLKAARRAMRPDAAVWVSWPKKSSGVATDITEDTIREIALPMGLVDI